MDGGVTWRQSPSQGIPAKQQILASVLGTLGDGSIVEAYADQSRVLRSEGLPVTLALYAWRIGDSAWRRVSPSLTATVSFDSQYLATPTNRLWILVYNHVSNKARQQVYTYVA
jgi:hypothetical protein